MKAAIVILTLALSACSSITPKNVVEIKVPVPYCPAPPSVDSCTFAVDTLTAADVSDPGKVAQAYKLDMMCLRNQVQSMRAIIDAYGVISVNAVDVERVLAESGANYTRALDFNAATKPQQ